MNVSARLVVAGAGAVLVALPGLAASAAPPAPPGPVVRFLAGPSDRPPATVALTYAKAHSGLYGLGAAAWKTLKLRRDYVDLLGTHHLWWGQQVRGLAVVGRGLHANVTSRGELVSLFSAPLTAPPPAPGAAALTAGEAAARAFVALTGRTVPSSDGRNGGTRTSQRVYYQTNGALRLAWQVLVRPSAGELDLVVVDAQDGRILRRDDLTRHDSADVWDNYPGAPAGGRQHTVDLSRRGWLRPGSTTLTGPNAHAFSDVRDDDVAQPSEEVRPAGRTTFRFAFKPFPSTQTPCTSAYPCSWDPSKPYSWRTNRKQNATQAFYFVNAFHDHLRAEPIGFTSAAGAFEGKDRLQTQTLDGAAANGGFPFLSHLDNANMQTPPDGSSPTMQMYLFHYPGGRYPSDDPFLAVNGGDDASTVYHEYTHGLDNRLVVDANGVTTLNSPQARSLDEAWADWFALDYLVDRKLVLDTSTPGEVRFGQYLDGGRGTGRKQPLDCPVAVRAGSCPGSAATGRGGFTYGDFGRIGGGPEVHYDGEIWGETLWELRTAVGSTAAEMLLTRAMELSPDDPSFLDQRNAVLEADKVAYRGQHQDALWRVFAGRGMGWFAATVDGNDEHPVEDFTLPPRAGTLTSTVTGVVRDATTKKPLAGVLVYVAGHRSGYAGDLASVSGKDGAYTLTGVPAGIYPEMAASRTGYDHAVATNVRVGARPAHRDLALRRSRGATG